jgi:hypothetical protein
MSNQPDATCVFCRQLAKDHKPDPDRSLHDVDCDTCGKYRIGGTARASMLERFEAWHADMLPLIAEANARGKRYWVPGGDEISLNK